MIEREPLRQIADAFMEIVDDETGIQLRTADLHVSDDGETLHLTIGRTLISTCAYDAGEVDPEDLAWELFEAAGDVKHILTRAKIAELAPHVSRHFDSIREMLKAVVGEEKSDDLHLEVKDTDRYGFHYMTDDEIDRGYPPIVLSIRDYDDIDFREELNIDYPEDALDMDQLRCNLNRYFKDSGR